jgi:DNA polymerase I
MEIQILDVDYTMVDNKPIVRFFGRNKEGESVCCFYSGPLPYFYAGGKDAEDILKKEGFVYEKSGMKVAINPDAPLSLFRVWLNDPSKTPDIRDKLKSLGLDVYEADIPFKNRVMCDLDFSGMGWLDVQGNIINTESVSASRSVQAKEIKRTEKDENAQFKMLAMDIETLMDSGKMDMKSNTIIIVSFVFSHPYNGKRSMVLSTRNGDGVNYYENEKAMLEGVKNIINGFDPDFITGYNINAFDLPSIIARMEKYKLRPVFGRCRQKRAFVKKVSAREKVYVPGRVVIDAYEIVKKDFSMPRYDLGVVCETLLQKGKTNVKHSEIGTFYHGTKEQFGRLVEYAANDSALVMEIIERLHLMDKYIALAKISGTLLQDVLNSGETARIENLLLREFNKHGYILPCKASDREMTKREAEREGKLVGGYVIEPDKGIHSNVAVFDFKSMYPSIIETYNICPTTLVQSGNSGDVIKTPSGAMFYKKSVREGIVPKIVSNLMKERGVARKRLKSAKTPEKVRALDAEQWALKIMSNAFYGHLGYVRARIYNMDTANAVTSCGRELIKKTVEYVGKKYGYKIVYGDTDSLMVKIENGSLDEIYEIGNKIAEDVTKQLEGSLELKFEKIFKRFLPLTKKRYAAWSFDKMEAGWKDRIETKGIETVRRDWCKLVSETVGAVLEILLKGGNIKEAENHFKGVLEGLVNGKIPIQKLEITKSMTKQTKGYKGMQPHIELAKKIQKRSPSEAPKIGDRIRYVIVKGTDLLCKRAEDPAFVLEKGLKIDPKYYIDNQLLPPLERLFTSIGVSKSELLGNGKQRGLLEILNSIKESQTTLRAADVTGFVCSGCGKFFQKVPLSGCCECGAGFVFSSQGGMAREIETSAISQKQ